MNLKIRQFSKSISDFVNDYDLPVEVKKICLENVLHKISSLADQAVIEEINQGDKEGKDAKSI